MGSIERQGQASRGISGQGPVGTELESGWEWRGDRWKHPLTRNARLSYSLSKYPLPPFLLPQPPSQAMETPDPLRHDLCVRDILNPAGDADEKPRDSLKSQPWEFPAPGSLQPGSPKESRMSVAPRMT